MDKIPTLHGAGKKIREHLPPLCTEKVALGQALGRVVAASLCAPQSYPAFHQSTRDGYAVSKDGFSEIDECRQYYILDEIPAGDTQERRSRPGFAHRIMTGAPVPRGTWKVIPQEMCRETNGVVSIPGSVVERGPSCIQGKGSGLRRGAQLLQAGECLTPVHIARLADSGVTEIPVFRQPKVSYFCSGSELVDSPAEQGNGQKISSNRHLLAGLIRGFGGHGHDHGGVRDEKSALQKRLKAILEHVPDVIISTGGMGPGRYDLMEETFGQCGGKMIFSALKLRPGKSVLFGTLGHSLYFGLPGPPSAVHALFHVLIRPTLMALQGFSKWKPDMVQAHLKGAMIIGKPGVLQIQEAVLSEKKGIFEVRRSTPREIADSYLFCPAAKRFFAEEELVSVLPWAPPPFLSVS